MFGTTSMTVSFSGRKVAAAFVQVKSITDSRASLVLDCTPVALGVGFNKNWGDRKSTRLNSSHLVISYAVFCLKKKKNSISSVRPCCSGQVRKAQWRFP